MIKKFIENNFNTKEEYLAFLKTSNSFSKYQLKASTLWIEKRNLEKQLNNFDFNKLPFEGNIFKTIIDEINAIKISENLTNDINNKLLLKMDLIIDLFLFLLSLQEMENIVKSDINTKLYESFNVIKKPSKMLNATLDLSIALSLAFKVEDYEKASWYLSNSFVNNKIEFNRQDFLTHFNSLIETGNFNDEVTTSIEKVSLYLEKFALTLKDMNLNSLSFVFKNRIRDAEYLVFLDSSFQLLAQIEKYIIFSFIK